jgi:hypothetical protein
MGKRKGEGNHSPPKKNLIQDSEVNEENGCPVLESKITKISAAKEPTMSTKTPLK